MVNLQTAWNFVAVHIAKNRQTTIQKINIYDFHQSCGKQPQHVKYQKFRHDCPKNGSAFGFGCFPLVRNFFYRSGARVNTIDKNTAEPLDTRSNDAVKESKLARRL